MDEKKPYLSLSYLRRFGTEIEINAFDGRNRPLKENALPEGIYYVGNLVQKTTGDNVTIHTWGHDHNNPTWIIKPDSSCGMEVCSPVSKGWLGLKSICRVIEAMGKDGRIDADHRCSLHVHVDVSDLTIEQLGSIIMWWIKCEPVFLDTVPSSRKRNRYCQFLGLCELFEHDSNYTMEGLIKKLGTAKYGTLNTYHLKNGKRQTIEFRIMGNECCLDPWIAKNWIRLILHFVEMAAARPMPREYEPDDPWTGYCWLDPQEVFTLLGFDGSHELSPGLKQVQSWFLSRALQNAPRTGLPGVMSDKARSIAYKQYKDIIVDYGVNVAIPGDLETAIYSDNFKV